MVDTLRSSASAALRSASLISAGTRTFRTSSRFMLTVYINCVTNASMRVAAYCRVSSRAQDLSMQRHAIDRAAKARGDVIADWRSEKRSGKLLTRPEIARVRTDARAGAI